MNVSIQDSRGAPQEVRKPGAIEGLEVRPGADMGAEPVDGHLQVGNRRVHGKAEWVGRLGPHGSITGHTPSGSPEPGL